MKAEQREVYREFLSEWDLTDDELAAIPRIAIGQPFPTILRLTAQAARRKMLEWLYLDCDVPAHQFCGSHIECSSCMADLRAKMEEK